MLWDRRWKVSLLPSLLWLLEFVANAYPLAHPSNVGKAVPGLPGCAGVALGPGERARLTWAISTGVAFDIVVTALVVVRCVSIRRRHAGAHELVEMLLLHGT